MAISAKESPKNHTDKERFAATSSCIATEILTLLFARKRRRSTGPVLYQPPRSRSRRVPDLKFPNTYSALSFEPNRLKNMSANPEDWDVDFAFPDFNLALFERERS